MAILFSVDIETTGPAPGKGSMISIGAVPVSSSGVIIPNGDFYVNVAEVFQRDPGTIDWWSKQDNDRWLDTLDDRLEPLVAMTLFRDWVHTQLNDAGEEKAIFCAWPVGFDWGFVNYYFQYYLGINPFGYSPLCMKNFAAGLLADPEILLSSRSEERMPEGFVVQPELPHNALSDAAAQAVMLSNMLRFARERQTHPTQISDRTE